MNNIVATNVRALREHKTWTQEHLAQIADVTPRTIQRAESGDGASPETLMALASAFDLTVDTLRTDWVALMQKAAEEQKALEAKYRMIPVTRVGSADDFDVLDSTFGLQMAVISGSEEARDVAAELQSYLVNLDDLSSDLQPTEKRESRKEALEYVRRLEALGCAVSVGLDTPKLRFDNDPNPPKEWRIGYVMVSLVVDLKPFVAVERGQRFNFG